MQANHKFVFLNGPPSSGKDTAAYILSRRFNTRVHEFKYPMHCHFAAMARIALGQYLTEYPKYKTEQVPIPPRLSMLGIVTPADLRQAYINFSEKYMKPQFGHGVFGRLAAGRATEVTGASMTAFPDSGFVEEVDSFITELTLSSKSAIIIQLFRPGCTYANDSRGYVTHDSLPLVTIDNDDSLAMFEYRLVKAIRQHFPQQKWTDEPVYGL